jgi:hypothetical protein
MKQHFKGVIWPRGTYPAKVKGNKNVQNVYRYIVVGMMVTDTPISQFEGKNEIWLDGPVSNLVEPFAQTKIKKRPNCYSGDATNILLGLNEW